MKALVLVSEAHSCQLYYTTKCSESTRNFKADKPINITSTRISARFHNKLTELQGTSEAKIYKQVGNK
jgi:hypothetical protein